MPLILTPKELDAVKRHAIEEYPRESCGVILERAGLRRLLRCRNIQDALHAKDPERHARDARTAYSIDPQDLLMISRLDGEGFQVAVIYHSHVDAQERGGGTGAYFSETDRQQAATYVVTSVVGGRIEAVAAFRWSAKRGDFQRLEIREPGRGWHERAAAGRAWAWLHHFTLKARKRR
ncbi:MAG: Mov34/MPN/PAD-1 family protein [Candidatus Rokubacteria bacterium]|nr:Mov34/MPN/PAD-1 family protein [Candidatus Rokubacteria bacterium]